MQIAEQHTSRVLLLNYYWIRVFEQIGLVTNSVTHSANQCFEWFGWMISWLTHKANSHCTNKREQSPNYSRSFLRRSMTQQVPIHHAQSPKTSSNTHESSNTLILQNLTKRLLPTVGVNWPIKTVAASKIAYLEKQYVKKQYVWIHSIHKKVCEKRIWSVPLIDTLLSQDYAEDL